MAGDPKMDEDAQCITLDVLPEECLFHIICQLSVVDNAAVARSSK
jgi:hypothetical protein